MWLESLAVVLELLVCFSTTIDGVLREALQVSKLFLATAQVARTHARPPDAPQDVMVADWSETWKKQCMITHATLASGAVAGELEKPVLAWVDEVAARQHLKRLIISVCRRWVIKGNPKAALVAIIRLEEQLPPAAADIAKCGIAMERISEFHEGFKAGKSTPALTEFLNIMSEGMKVELTHSDLMFEMNDFVENFNSIKKEWSIALTGHRDRVVSSAATLTKFLEKFEPVEECSKNWAFESVPWLKMGTSKEDDEMAKLVVHISKQALAWKNITDRVVQVTSTISNLEDNDRDVIVDMEKECGKLSALNAKASLALACSMVASLLLREDPLAHAEELKASMAFVTKELQLQQELLPHKLVLQYTNRIREGGARAAATTPAAEAPAGVAPASDGKRTPKRIKRS